MRLSALVTASFPVLLLAACQQNPAPEPTSQATIAEACGTTTWDLTAGQHINVGTVTVSNDTTNVYIVYQLSQAQIDAGATLGNLHVWVGSSLLNLPQNNNGVPVPGQFCKALGGACADASGQTSYTFTIPFTDLNIVDVKQACGLPLYVFTHAEVNNTQECTIDQNGVETCHNAGGQTAWGGNQGGNPDVSRWYFYGVYNVCCDIVQPPPVINICETAFAKGGWVWTTNNKSNPEKLPSLKLTQNRWGWAINLVASGTTTYDIWAGAGLNNTGNGTLVGTLTVNWDGTNVTVTYNVNGVLLEEVHIYAGADAPTTIAPGQYGWTVEFDPGQSSYSATLPLVDDGNGVWVVAHAVVCSE